MRYSIPSYKAWFLVLLFILSFGSVATYSQTFGRLRGIVTDSTNGEALAFANVYIKQLQIGTSTDANGYYLISSVPAGKRDTLTVSYIGYQPKSKTFIILPNKITNIDFKLSVSNVELSTVEKIGKKIVEQNSTDLGLKRISIKSLETLPKGVETDVFRSLQYIPGVNFTGDVSAKYYVRGSDDNQNLVLLNGATIYNPFHALGLFSVIDPDMIKNIKFYKGGFPAEYGGRLSSVMDLITIDGNRNRFGAKASLSMLTAKALLEGPLPHGSFVITGRKSYSTRILKKFLNDKTLPSDFYDTSIKLNYSNPNLIHGAKFVVNYFRSSDALKNNDLLKEDFSWSDNVFGFSWYQVYDVPLFSEFNISFSKFKGQVSPNFSSARALNNELSDITLNYKYNYIYANKDELTFGMHISSIDSKLSVENNAGILTETNGKGANFTIFSDYKFLRFENFGLNIGARYNLTGISAHGANYIEPRISFTYRPFGFLSIKGAWGKYQQELTTVSDENDVISLFEPYIIVPGKLKTPRATHYSLGAVVYFTDSWKLTTEIYYKDLSNITALKVKRDFSGGADLTSADGESYGVEVSSVIVVEPFRFVSSYTLSYAYKEVDNWLYYPKYDSRHFVNLLLEYSLGKGWKTSITWTYKTGLPFTPTTGFYDKLFLSDFRGDWDIYSNYIPFLTLGDKNIARLPNYHRMDVSLSKDFKIGITNFSLNVSIINVYNRKNIFYFDRSTGKQVNMLPFLPTFSIKVKL